MAEVTEGVTFLPLADLVTKEGDTSYHAMDLVHPSVKGSRAIAARSKNHAAQQRVGGFQEGADQSLQLWALPPAGGPRSLGVLGHEKLLTLTAGERDVQQVPTLAISLEPKGGVPSEGGPTGPVLFKGALIRKAT